MSLDPRAERLVDIILDYSLEVGNDDILMIHGEDSFREFAELYSQKASIRGAESFQELYNLDRKRELIQRGHPTELSTERDRLCGLARKATKRVRIYASEDPTYLNGVDPDDQALYGKVVEEPFINIVTGDGKDNPGMPWNLHGFPSRAHARLSDMSYEDYSDFVYKSILDVDWLQLKDEMESAKEVMDGAEDVHIVVPGMTDFHVSLRGRGAKLCYGKRNMPDGEFFYGPVEGSARGYITFPHGTTYRGAYAKNIRLEFDDAGKAIIERITADDGEELIRELLRQAGADIPGELGIGCNNGILLPMNNILFDEKMGGTIHLAMGDSYKRLLSDGGGKNSSSVHWDMICDLRPILGMPGGNMYVDDKLVRENGIWVFK